MTHDERISSYIDNELSMDQEQEFLISLAANEGLRKSFRSELVLKKVLHRDEATTNPPRRLRGALFATLGLGAASLAPQKSNAAQQIAGNASRGLVKTFFATKMTTLATVAGISASALIGYGVRSVVTPSSAPAVVHQSVPNASPTIISPSVATPSNQQVSSQNSNSSPSVASTHHAVIHRAQNHASPNHPISSTPPAKTEPVSGATGTGAPIEMKQPKIGH